MKAKIILTHVICICCIINCLGQNIGISAVNFMPHASAILDVSSTAKGFLTPRMLTAQRLAIQNPATGLLVYDIQLNGFQYYNGISWLSLSDSGTGTEWKLQGNSGIDPGQHFIGTTDLMPIHFRVNNLKAGRIDVLGNSCFGLRAGMNNTTGQHNIAIGQDALLSNQTSSSLIAVGDSALYANTSGVANVAIGSNTLSINTTGNLNNAIGYEALRYNIGGEANDAFGVHALHKNQGNHNVAVGILALAENYDGSENTAIGAYAGSGNQEGSENTIIGFHSHANTTYGNQNTIVGALNMDENLEGNGNTVVGYNAFRSLVIGHNNVGIGNHVDIFPSINNATVIGSFAKAASSNCIILGSIPGQNGAGPMPINVGIGTVDPLTRMHIAGGTDASYNQNSGYLMTGQSYLTNIVMDDNEIMARNNGLASPLFLQASGGNLKIGGTGAPNHLLELASNSAAKPGSNTWTVISDSRLKKDVAPFEEGLEIITQINPVSYRYNGLADIKDTSTFVGILAQDIQEIAPYMINTFSVTDEEGRSQEYLKYDGNAMTYLMINAIKTQQGQIEALSQELENMQEMLQSSTELLLQMELLRVEIQTLKAQSALTQGSTSKEFK